ncbi:MAG: cation transporter, partial [Firmicutes bacterium]|nr:cation transporter [Bacillota bacterium]
DKKGCESMSVNGELRVEVPENCTQCDNLIKEKLTGIDGVEAVNVNMDVNKVTVRFDEKTATLVHIKQALMEEGFTVVEI